MCVMLCVSLSLSLSVSFSLCVCVCLCVHAMCTNIIGPQYDPHLNAAIHQFLATSYDLGQVVTVERPHA